MKHLQTRLFLLLSLAALLILPVSAGAQATVKWEAWMYNPANGEIIRVHSLGAALGRQTLPSLPNYRPSSEIAFSHNGRYAAYAIVDDHPRSNQEFYVYDTQNQSLVMSYKIPANTGDTVFNSLDVFGSRHIFNANDTEVAFGYQVNATWSVAVFDIANGSIIKRLTQTHPNFSNVQGDLPVPRYYDGTSVYFTYVMTPSGGAPTFPAFRWNMLPNTIDESDLYVELDSDTFGPSGEMISTRSNATLPNNINPQQQMVKQQNALHVGTLGNLSTFPAYNDQNYTLWTPRFIENGQAILMNANPLGSGSGGWRVIDRAGNVRGNMPIGNVSPSGIFGTADGVVYSVRAKDIRPYLSTPPSRQNTNVLVYAETRNGLTAGRITWAGQPGNYPVLAWVGDNFRNQRNIPSGGWNDLSINLEIPPITPGQLDDDLPQVPTEIPKIPQF